MVFARLRIELADHPGALAAVTRVLAAVGLNVVEVSIHEAEPPRAVDEIVVHAEDPLQADSLSAALAAVGAELLSVAPCDMRGDAVVTALTWVTATLEKPARKSSLATGVRLLTGIDPVHVFTVEESREWPIVAAALRRTDRTRRWSSSRCGPMRSGSRRPSSTGSRPCSTAAAD